MAEKKKKLSEILKERTSTTNAVIEDSFNKPTKKSNNMPVELENKLKKRAVNKFPKNKKKQNAYVYGTLNKVKK